MASTSGASGSAGSEPSELTRQRTVTPCSASLASPSTPRSPRAAGPSRWPRPRRPPPASPPRRCRPRAGRSPRPKGAAGRLERVPYRGRDAGQTGGLLGQRDAPGQGDGVLGQVARADLDAHRARPSAPSRRRGGRTTCRRGRRAATRTPGAAQLGGRAPARLAARPSSSLTTSTTTWTGASRGGTRSPLSSPWPMISAADQPGGHAPRRLPDVLRVRRLGRGTAMPNALAKFWPSSWLVPICRALPSPIIPSQVQRVVGAGEPLARASCGPTSDGHGEHVDHEVLVDLVQDAQGVVAGVVLGGVARCGPPARGTRWCAGTAGAAAPSARRWPTG